MLCFLDRKWHADGKVLVPRARVPLGAPAVQTLPATPSGFKREWRAGGTRTV